LQAKPLAETITLNGVARTVSLTTALYGCGRYYPINTPLIEKMASASRRIGEEVAAREGKNWHAILVAELQRRITEVAVGTMKREGIADADIELMLRKNPAKLLGLDG
jgi:hypothetical protein